LSAYISRGTFPENLPIIFFYSKSELSDAENKYWKTCPGKPSLSAYISRGHFSRKFDHNSSALQQQQLSDAEERL
jgi:hypothetical protein